MEQANSVADYLKILERYKAYSSQYYRGQLEKYVTIPPSIARNRGYFSNESAIYHESIGMKKDEFKDLLTPLERLAKLQHYGIPTRLVDVTIDPLIALFFAVENVDDLSPGNVYVYLVEGYPSNSKEAKLLSILPTLPDLKVDSIIAEYKKIFGGTLSYEEVLKIVCTPIIIQYSDELQVSNPRLHSQQGTFLICGNEVVDNRIIDSLKSLDAITPSVIIRIPYEYKKAIKDELDLKYSVNQTRIYPELPSVADYIKEKYKEENLSLDGKYSIVKTEDVSHALAKRISITIVLTEPMRIDQIKSLVVSIIDQHKKDANVVWVYVARNGDDYILSNWIIRGQWIDPHLNKKYCPLTLKTVIIGIMVSLTALCLTIIISMYLKMIRCCLFITTKYGKSFGRFTRRFKTFFKKTDGMISYQKFLNRSRKSPIYICNYKILDILIIRNSMIFKFIY